MKFRAHVDVVESMGSELYAYFDIDTQGEVQSEELADLAKDAGLEDLPSGGAQHVVARLDAGSKAAAGSEIELTLDTTQVKLFDPDGGRSLTYSGGSSNGAGARAASATA
jgi:multiple sugar transport system ATP-binding protein